jgi:hypothetical protein
MLEQAAPRGREEGARACAARRSRRARDERARVRRPARGGALEELAKRRGRRLPRRLRRRAHEDHHGPLRGGLGHGRAGWQAHVRGEGSRSRPLARGHRALRDRGQSGRHRPEPPGVRDRGRGKKPVGPIRDGAAVMFFNFRGDRAIEISRAFEDATFTEFDRGPAPRRLLRRHDAIRRRPHSCRRASSSRPPEIDRTIGEVPRARRRWPARHQRDPEIRARDLLLERQPLGKFDEKLETYVEIPSDTLPFEERPWMKAAEITDRVIAELKTGKHRTRGINYANGDMVGHTGIFESTVIAVEAVDLMPRAARAGRARAGRRADRHRGSRQRRRDVRAGQEGQGRRARRERPAAAEDQPHPQPRCLVTSAASCGWRRQPSRSASAASRRPRCTSWGSKRPRGTCRRCWRRPSAQSTTMRGSSTLQRRGHESCWLLRSLRGATEYEHVA